MSIGVLSYRYAEALLRYTRGSEQGDRIYAQARVIEQNIASVPELGRLLADPETVSAAEKMRLLESVLAPDELDPKLKRFLFMVVSKGRAELLRMILKSFADRYDKEHDNLRATLTTAVPLSEEMKERVRMSLSDVSGKNVFLETAEDPGIIGGAMLVTGGHLLDISVKTQLDTLRKELTDKNKRIF